MAEGSASEDRCPYNMSFAPIEPVSMHQTVYAEGITPFIVRTLNMGWYRIAEQHGVEAEGEARVLVRREEVSVHTGEYTVDYMTTRTDRGWLRQTVVYRRGEVSPLPPTRDARSVLYAHGPAIPSSSAIFRSAAAAMLPQ